MTIQTPIPLRPAYSEAAAGWRSVTTQCLGQTIKEDPTRVVRRLWPHDEAAGVFTRTAVTPSDRIITALSGTSIGPFLSGIAPRSAAGRLFSECLRVELAGLNKASLPRMSTVPSLAFVKEGDPVPVAAGVFTPVDLGPARKLMLITGMTRELAELGADGAEGIVRTAIGESAQKDFDGIFFDTTEGDDTRPSGLLFDVTPVEATTGGGLAALVSDVQKLVAAIRRAEILDVRRTEMRDL